MYIDFVIKGGLLVMFIVNILLILKTESSMEYSTFSLPEYGADNPESAPQGMSLIEKKKRKMHMRHSGTELRIILSHNWYVHTPES
jgi:hypothetical protein